METIGLQFRIVGATVKLDELEMSRLAEFCRQHPNSGGIMSLSAYDEDISVNQYTYYKKVLIPSWQKIFLELGDIFGLETTEEKLNEYFAIPHFSVEKFLDMDKKTASNYITLLIQKAAEQGFEIPPPR